ncbi:MAG: DoxX family protein [Myxococcota bacterium]
METLLRSTLGTGSVARRTALIVFLLPLTVLIAIPAVLKAVGVDWLVENMAELHYSVGVTHAIGVFEVLLVPMLWYRRFRGLALLAILILMAGGAGSHIAAGHELGRYAPNFVIGALVLGVFALDRGRGALDFLVLPANPAKTSEV